MKGFIKTKKRRLKKKKGIKKYQHGEGKQRICLWQVLFKGKKKRLENTKEKT